MRGVGDARGLGTEAGGTEGVGYEGVLEDCGGGVCEGVLLLGGHCASDIEQDPDRAGSYNFFERIKA